MQPVPLDLMKAYVQSQHFTSTAEIMQAVKDMFRDVIQQVVEVEMDEELGRERCQRSHEPKIQELPEWLFQKIVKTQWSEIEIKVPRDRNGSFEPKIISKYNRNADGTEEKTLSVCLRHEPAGYFRADKGNFIMWRFLRNW